MAKPKPSGWLQRYDDDSYRLNTTKAFLYGLSLVLRSNMIDGLIRDIEKAQDSLGNAYNKLQTKRRD